MPGVMPTAPTAPPLPPMAASPAALDCRTKARPSAPPEYGLVKLTLKEASQLKPAGMGLGDHMALARLATDCVRIAQLADEMAGEPTVRQPAKFAWLPAGVLGHAMALRCIANREMRCSNHAPPVPPVNPT